MYWKYGTQKSGFLNLRTLPGVPVCFFTSLFFSLPPTSAITKGRKPVTVQSER